MPRSQCDAQITRSQRGLQAVPDAGSQVVPDAGSSTSSEAVTAGWSIYDKIKLKRDPNMTMKDAPFLTLGTSSCAMWCTNSETLAGHLHSVC